MKTHPIQWGDRWWSVCSWRRWPSVGYVGIDLPPATSRSLPWWSSWRWSGWPCNQSKHKHRELHCVRYYISETPRLWDKQTCVKIWGFKVCSDRNNHLLKLMKHKMCLVDCACFGLAQFRPLKVKCVIFAMLKYCLISPFNVLRQLKVNHL